jgi:hypothetical protein
LNVKNAILFLFAALWLAACSANTQTPVPSATPLPPLPDSMKGYELYSWQADDEWHFTLITGTNRMKTPEEITTGEDEVTADGWVKIRVQVTDAIQEVLSRLPAGEEVFWAGTGWMPGDDFTLPPQDTVQAIQEYCKSLKLVLYVSE